MTDKDEHDGYFAEGQARRSTIPRRTARRLRRGSGTGAHEPAEDRARGRSPKVRTDEDEDRPPRSGDFARRAGDRGGLSAMAAARAASNRCDDSRSMTGVRSPHVLIIGGGGTGGALAHDLALRGIAGHAGRARGVHVRDHRSPPRPAAQRRALRRQRQGVGGGVHRGEHAPSAHPPGLVRGERRPVRRRHRRGHGLSRRRSSRAARQTGIRTQDLHARRGAAAGADAEPRAEGRGAGARRHDGRDADAAAVLRHGEGERGATCSTTSRSLDLDRAAAR